MRVMLIVLVAATAVAHADGTDGAQRVPDASLRAIQERDVRLELDGAPAIEGRLLGFEATTVTLATAGTNEVITVPRASLLRVTTGAPTTLTTERLRVVGVQMSLLGTVAVDAEYKRLRGFASTSLLLPIATASGSSTWVAAAAGAGMTFPIGKSSRWNLDVFGQVVPFHTTSFYTYLGFGVGAGAHYTAPSGFTLGVSFPVLGFSTRLGSSPYGYDASFRYNDSLAYYYAGALAGMPLLTMGYRFATNCPRE
jgi:hypothetical protein